MRSFKGNGEVVRTALVGGHAPHLSDRIRGLAGIIVSRSSGQQTAQHTRALRTLETKIYTRRTTSIYIETPSKVGEETLPASRKVPRNQAVYRLRKHAYAAGWRLCRASQRTGWPCDARGQSTSKGFPRAIEAGAQATAAIWAGKQRRAAASCSWGRQNEASPRTGEAAPYPIAKVQNRQAVARQLRERTTTRKQNARKAADHCRPADTSAGTLPSEYRRAAEATANKASHYDGRRRGRTRRRYTR